MLGLLVRTGSPAVHQLADGCMRAALACGSMREYANFAVTNTGNVAGPGGRSSASGITATVFGGYGFIGSYIVSELGRKGSQVVIPTRTTENKVQHIRQMGDLGQIVFVPQFDIRDDALVRKAISRSNVVINLIGQRTETMNYKYEEVHADWPKKLATIVAESGHVERLIHFSDMGADAKHTSRRMRTKAQGDADLLKIFPTATIFKPAPVVGIEDYFYNYIIYQVSYSLIAPLVNNGPARVQPTYVLDVANAVTKSLLDKSSVGKTYHLAGPETLTYREVYDVIIKTLRLKTDDTIPVPAWAAKLAFAPNDWSRRALPSLPLSNWMASADYVEEQLKDKVSPYGALGYSDLGIIPAKVTEGLPIEPVRHYRTGGYNWGDMATVAKDVPEAIRKYYNIK